MRILEQTEQQTHPAKPPPATRHRRLAWLDVLRGLAALLVVYSHLKEPLFPELGAGPNVYFDAGKYGVMVFFLVSGYIVPASLERKGSVGGFWIGRACRLYPLWAVAVLAAVLCVLAGFGPPNPQLAGHRVSATATLANATMLQDLLGSPHVLGVMWTLSYEMVFYLLVTAMFVLGVHRRSTETALGLGAAALLVGGLLPTAYLSTALLTGPPHGTLLLVAAVVMVVGGCLAAVLRGGQAVRRVAAALLGALVLGLMLVNQRAPGWESLTILATMFAGTAIYRAESGQVGWRHAALVVAVVPVCGILAGVLNPTPWAWPAFGWAWSTAIGGAWLTFGIGLLLRRRTMPAALAWLGTVSYSLYLLHPLLLHVVRLLVPDPGGTGLAVRLGVLAGFVAALLALSALTYRWVEAPMQAVGRRLITRSARPVPVSTRF